MLKDQLTLLFCLRINDIPVDGFHHIIRGPAAALHNVLIRDSDRVHDRRGIMPQVMKAEVGELTEIQNPLEFSRELIGIQITQRPFFTAYMFKKEFWHLYGPIAAVGFGRFGYPLIVFAAHDAFADSYGVPLDITGSQGADFAAAKRTKCRQKNGCFQISSRRFSQEPLDVCVVRTI